MGSGPRARSERAKARGVVREHRRALETHEGQKGGYMAQKRQGHLDAANQEFLKVNRATRQVEGKPVSDMAKTMKKAVPKETYQRYKKKKKKLGPRSVQSQRTPEQRRKAAKKRVRRLLAASGRDLIADKEIIALPGDPEKYTPKERGERQRRLAYQAGKASEVGPVASPSVTKALQKKGTSKSKLHKGKFSPLPFVRKQQRTKGPTARGS